MPPIYIVPARLATEPQLPEITDEPVHFDITPNGLEITIEGTSTTPRAEVQNSGTTSIPFTVLAGVLYIRYFGKNTVEIGCSHGKMRVDTTVFAQPQYSLDWYTCKRTSPRLRE